MAKDSQQLLLVKKKGSLPFVNKLILLLDKHFFYMSWPNVFLIDWGNIVLKSYLWNFVFLWTFLELTSFQSHHEETQTLHLLL